MKLERLGNICKVRNGYAFKSENFTEEGVPIIRISDINNNLVDAAKAVRIKYEPVFENFKVAKGDILIAMSGATTGKFGIYISDEIAYQNQRVGCFRIRDENKLNYSYLLQTLRILKPQIEKNAYGGGQPNISATNIEDLKIPLPSISDQIQIANLLSKTETLATNRKEGIHLLDKYLTSIFYEMFGDPIRNEMNWDLELFEKLVSQDCPLTYGIVQPGEDFSNGVPVVRPVDLTETYVKRKGLKLIDPRISQQFKRTVLKGFEILMCVRGTTGVVSIASKELEGCNVTRGIVPIWFSESYNSLFAFFLLKSIGVQKEIQKYTYGATLQQINLGDLRKIKLIQPPLETQNKFAEIAQSVTDLKEFYKESLQELENLYGSLSQQAFKGELEFRSTKQPFIGDPFVGVEIPEGKLPTIDDLDKTKWIDITDPQKENVTKVVSNSVKKDPYETLFPLIGKVTGRGGDLRDIELLISKHFKDGYFVFEDLKRVFVDMGFTYDFELLKNFVFELLRKGKIQQVFADASFKTKFTDQHPDFKKVNELKEQMYLQRTTVL